MTFEKFRKQLAAKIPADVGPHFDFCRDVLLDVEFEGPSMFNVSSTSIHAGYEICIEDYEADFDSYFNFEGCSYLQDWMMDMHMGLCPESISQAILDEVPADREKESWK